jgi:hypothetical protein
MILCVALNENRDPAIFECHIDVLIPKNLLDKLKVASSRDPSELSQSIESAIKQVQSSISTPPSTMVDPTLPA